MGKSLELSCHFLATPQTFEEVLAFQKQQRSAVRISHEEFLDWDHLQNIEKLISPSDLIMIPLPRSGGVSYKLSHESIPRLMARHFEHFSFILIYSSAADDTTELMFSHDFDNTIIEKGMTLVKGRAKWFSKLFKHRN